MKNIMHYVFAASLIVVIAVGLYIARDWNSTTALFPRLVGYPMITLVMAILATDFKKRRRQDGDGENLAESEFIATEAAWSGILAG